LSNLAFWIGGASDDNWSSGANWLSNHKPANDGTANIDFFGSMRTYPDVDMPWSVASVSFDSGAAHFRVIGEQITVGSGGITNNSTTTTEDFLNRIALSAPQTWSSA